MKDQLLSDSTNITLFLTYVELIVLRVQMLTRGLSESTLIFLTIQLAGPVKALLSSKYQTTILHAQGFSNDPLQMIAAILLYQPIFDRCSYTTIPVSKRLMSG